LAWKSDLKVTLLTLGPSCPLKTLLLSHLVGSGSMLQIVIAKFLTNLKHVKQQFQSAAGSHTLPSTFKFKKSKKM
jgi:hypothetical protein